MHTNSIKAYEEIRPKLSKARREVADIINTHGPITRQRIGRLLGWEINRVTGRVKELKDAGVVEESGSVEGRSLLQIKRAQGELF